MPEGERGLVFPNTLGNIETIQNIHARFWVPLQNKCGLTDNGEPRYGFHVLRHAAASLFIKYLAGHRSGCKPLWVTHQPR
jgi:integrase